MKLHELKIKPIYYNAVVKGEKRFEIRKNDRNFKVGDLIRLKEFNDGYTGRESLYEIIFKLDGGEYGLEEGYCILSIKPYGSETYIVTSDNKMEFRRELKRKIERAQTDRFIVEIQ